MVLEVKNLPANAGDKEMQFNPWVGKMEEEMATNSNALAWRIPWTEEPRVTHIHIGSQRVEHD